MAAIVRGVNDSSAQSPFTVAAVSNMIPLKIICRAVDGNGSSPSSWRFAYDVPITQPTQASWMAITPITNARPLANWLRGSAPVAPRARPLAAARWSAKPRRLAA